MSEKGKNKRSLKNEYRQIVVNFNTYNLLKNLGRTADSFNDVIMVLINEHRRLHSSLALTPSQSEVPVANPSS